MYRGFSTSQKCWAHLLRKAIRVTLREPDNTQYRLFLDGLLGERYDDPSEPADDIERDFRNLLHELVRLLGGEELFTFFLHPATGGTNNAAERSLRGATLDR